MWEGASFVSASLAVFAYIYIFVLWSDGCRFEGLFIDTVVIFGVLLSVRAVIL